MWLILSIACLLANTGLRLTQKSFFTHTSLNAFRANWLMHAVSLPVFIAAALANFSTIQHLSVTFWVVLIAVVSGFYPLVYYLLFKVIKTNDLSEVLPLMSLIPIVTLLTGWLLLAQTPSAIGLIGTVLVSISIYVLRFRPGMHWLQPFKLLFQSGAARAMLVVSIITAVAAIGDKFAIDRSSIAVYSSLNMVGAFIVLFASDLFFSPKDLKHEARETLASIRYSWVVILSMGLLLLMAQITGFAALKYAPNSGYAVGVRNLYIVLASVIALRIFHERTNRYKLLSYGLSALGLIMIAL
jgi:drug/metabolite transporter (DMT)-like permease